VGKPTSFATRLSAGVPDRQAKCGYAHTEELARCGRAVKKQIARNLSTRNNSLTIVLLFLLTFEEYDRELGRQQYFKSPHSKSFNRIHFSLLRARPGPKDPVIIPSSGFQQKPNFERDDKFLTMVHTDLTSE
jgi:hypothetical protein